MKYKLTSLEKKTSKNGKPYAIVFLQDDTGEYKASLWDGIETVTAGQEVEGDIVTSGDFTNFRLKGQERPRGGGNKRAIEEAMALKQANIQHSMEQKDISIKVSSSQRDATLILTTLLSRPNDKQRTLEEIQEMWRNLRDWLMDEYDNETTRLKHKPNY